MVNNITDQHLHKIVSRWVILFLFSFRVLSCCFLRIDFGIERVQCKLILIQLCAVRWRNPNALIPGYHQIPIDKSHARKFGDRQVEFHQRTIHNHDARRLRVRRRCDRCLSRSPTNGCIKLEESQRRVG